MTRLRRIPALMLAVVLALAVGIGPAPLLAAPTVAPALQEAEPAVAGYYESDVLPGDENTPDLVVGLILYEDGSAEVLSDYENQDEVITEVGTWVDNGDGTLTLTVTGTSEADYAAPVELDFEIADDGSLVVPGAENGAFGEEGLTLFPNELGNDILAQLPAEALVYQSDVMSSTASPGLQLTLALFDDESLTLVSDYMSPGLIVVEVGTWTQDEDGNLVITLTGQIEDGAGTVTEFEAPLEFVFVANEDGSLSLVDEGGALFGDEGLTLQLVQEGFAATGSLPTEQEPGEATEAITGTESLTGTEAVTEVESITETEEATETEEITVEATPVTTETAEAEAGDIVTDETSITETMGMTPSGAYVSDVLPSQDEAGTFLVSIFYDDGSVLISTYPLNGDLPTIEVGSWASNPDGTFTITATGTLEEDYDEPFELEFTIDEDGILSLSGISLYPLADLDLSIAPTVLAEFQSDIVTDTTGLTQTVTLTLYDDEELSAVMVTSYIADGEVYTEYGTWDVNEDEQIVVTLTGDDEIDFEEPIEWLFDMSDEGVLTLVNDEEGFYGETGLTLLPVEVEEQLLEEDVTDAAGTSGETADEETADEEAADEEAAAGDGTSTADMAATENIQIFQSDVLPAASSPGLQLTLGLLDDGSAAIDYDYLNGEAVVTNTGEWADNEDGTITITFTEGPNGTFDVPVEMTLELGDDGNLTIVDASEESLGLLDVVLAPVVLE